MIDVGENPDRPRPGRKWLRNVYRVHQRLAMAFPSDPRKKADPEFLKPYAPEEFPEAGHAEDALAGRSDVHEGRSDKTGFLYRIDRSADHGPVILVQSARRPDWDYAFGLTPGAREPERRKPVGNAGCLLAAPPQTKEITCEAVDSRGVRLRIWQSTEETKPDQRPPDKDSILETGANLRFRLNANPTRRLANGPFQGKRVGIGRNRMSILDWLARKAASHGFELVFKPQKIEHEKEPWDPRWRITTGIVCAWKSHQEQEDEDTRKMQFASALIDGILRITQPQEFVKALESGIGPAKAFGFGLLSLTRA